MLTCGRGFLEFQEIKFLKNTFKKTVSIETLHNLSEHKKDLKTNMENPKTIAIVAWFQHLLHVLEAMPDKDDEFQV